MFLTNNHDSPSIIIELPIKGHYPTLGLEAFTNDASRIIVDNMKTKTPAYRILRWRTTTRGATIKRLNETDLNDENHLKTLIEKCVKMKLKKVSIEMSPAEKIKTHVDSTSLQTSFDQMSIMAD